MAWSHDLRATADGNTYGRSAASGPMDAARVAVGLGYVGLLVAAGAGLAVAVGAVTVPASVAEIAVLESLLRTVRAFPPVGLAATVVLCVWGLWRLAGP